MHVTTKEVAGDAKTVKELGVEPGTHILSITVEADGPFEIASPKASLNARVIACRRTASGGVFIQTALTVTEPTPVAPAKPQTQDEIALEFLASTGLSTSEAQSALERFGSARVLAKKADAEKAKHEALDGELDALLSKK